MASDSAERAWNEIQDEAMAKANEKSLAARVKQLEARCKQHEQTISDHLADRRRSAEYGQRREKRIAELEAKLAEAIEHLVDMVNQHCDGYDREGNPQVLFDGALSANEDAIAYLVKIGRVKNGKLVGAEDGSPS